MCRKLNHNKIRKYLEIMSHHHHHVTGGIDTQRRFLPDWWQQPQMGFF